jgi:macrodomain Ter protein organizer (MatP/YcbG family)
VPGCHPEEEQDMSSLSGSEEESTTSLYIHVPVPNLQSLAPQYSNKHHGLYYSILKRTIEDKPKVRNIALAGTYGTGKSSVLSKIADEFKHRAIEVSLLTLGVEPDSDKAGNESNPAATTTTNRIQKEIVKQLLYQQKPSNSPESRFRRITRFHWPKEHLLAFVAGASTLLVALLIGLDISVLPNMGLSVANLPLWLRVGSPYVAVVVGVWLVVLLARLLAHGKLGIEKVTAGPATITLPPRSTSYFDEYIDEIIYFFETNKKCDIVIIEDLDRFNDARIFESLRSLNGLLNSAKQLKGRNIRFIYAVRDSVFENLGRKKVASPSPDDIHDSDVEKPQLKKENGVRCDAVREENVRANRTKFFDLIVPVVPFITHKNARDLMHDLLKDRNHEISPDLVDLAARHTADMRLIHNIVNEYEVYKHRLLDVPTPVPQLTAERLFALILFKNTHLADFEEIRRGESSLDGLYDAWRALVSSNIQKLRTQTDEIRANIDNKKAGEDYAAKLASQLRSLIDMLAQAPGSGLVDNTLRVDNVLIEEDRLQAPAFWQDLVENGREIVLTARTSSYYGSGAQPMSLSVQDVKTLIGSSLDIPARVERSVSADLETIARKERGIELLRRHDWTSLLEHPEFKFAVESESKPLSFRGWVEHHLTSPLAVDLLVNGYITPYFSLHVSGFYAKLIRLDAMNFLMRCIDRGEADRDYNLNAADVESILRERGKNVLRHRSIFNVSILDYLLIHRPEDASVVINTLVGSDDQEIAFVNHYLSIGRAKVEFVEQLTSRLPNIFSLLAKAASLDRAERARLIDAAIAYQSADIEYEFSDELRTFVESDYGSFPSLTLESKDALAQETVKFVVSSGACLPTVRELSDAVCNELSHTRAYKLNVENLERVARTDSIALDLLKTTNREIYDYALVNISEYLKANRAWPRTIFTIGSPEQFVAILNGSQGWTEEDYEGLVYGSATDCMVAELEQVPNKAWRSLVSSLRVTMTFENVSSYVQWAGEIDKNLAFPLSLADEIIDVDSVGIEERMDLALKIINSSAELQIAANRVALARSLSPGPLPTAAIEPEPGEVVGLLIEAELIEDDEDAFTARLMTDWKTLEFAISKSSNFEGFVSPNTLESRYIASVMRSPLIGLATRRQILHRLSKFDIVPKDAYEAIAECGLQGKLKLTATGIEIVRKGGVPQTTIIKLLAQAETRISVDDLRQMLRSLGGRYAAIADVGRKKPEFENTADNRAILQRLKGASIVNRFEPNKEGNLVVSLKRTES